METIVYASCVLHNYLRVKYPRMQQHIIDDEDPATHALLPGAWREYQHLAALEVLRGNNATRCAKGMRDYLCGYYTSEVGRVPWQDNMI